MPATFIFLCQNKEHKKVTKNDKFSTINNSLAPADQYKSCECYIIPHC